MAKPLRPGSPIMMPGVPDEEENKNKVPLAPATDNEQVQGEQTLQQLANTPPAQPAAPQPEDAMASYQRLSKQAEEATPSEEDVLAANLRRTGAQLRAEAPAYLEKAAETLFYKPDYSQITRVAEGEAKQPDMILSAKEQAQRRLEALAEGARKRALLPAQQAEMQARTAKTKIESEEAQLKMDALKESARLNADKNAPASPEDIKKFRDKFGKFGADVPDSIKKGELSKAWSDVTEQAVKGGFTIQAAKIGAEAKEKSAEIGAEGRKEAAAGKLTEDERKRNVPGVGVAITKNDADKLKESAIGHSGITKALSDISKDYGIITNPNTKTTEKIAAAQRMKVTQSKVLMDYKKFFELGAPQKAELDFLGELVGKPSSTDLVKTIVSDKTFGTDLNTRLSTLKSLLDSDFDNVKTLRLEKPEQQTPAAAPTTPTSAAPAAMVDVIAPNGQRGRIPKDKLDAARKKGFKLLGE